RQDRRAARPQDTVEPEGRHLRRAWRRSRLGCVLPRHRARLRLVLALSRADRAARRGAGRDRQGGREPGLTLSLVIARSVARVSEATPGSPAYRCAHAGYLDFVDPIFTTSMQATFTNASAVKAETHATACLCRARNAD